MEKKERSTKVEMKIKIIYDGMCYHDRNLSNEQNLGVSVKVANENVTSTGGVYYTLQILVLLIYDHEAYPNFCNRR